MSAIYEVEIYKQKYETFRHHDRIRWQIVQLSIVSSGGILIFDENMFSHYWPSVISRAAIGVILIFLSLVIIQLLVISSENNKALKAIAEKIGDSSTPDTSHQWRRITIMMSLFFGLIGLGSILSILVA